jgi:hypothetical protein
MEGYVSNSTSVNPFGVKPKIHAIYFKYNGDGTTPSQNGGNLACGAMWNPDVLYQQKMFFEIMVTSENKGQYFVSDTQGGRHILLFGSDGSNGTEYRLTGNMWFDVGGTPTPVSYGSGVAFRLKQLYVFGMSFDGTTIVTYANGVPVGIVATPNDRRNYLTGSSDGVLHFGAVDHNQHVGFLVWSVLYDNPEIPINHGGYYPAKRLPRVAYTEIGNDMVIPCQGMWNFTNPYNYVVPDLSDGFDDLSGANKLVRHPAVFSSGNSPRSKPTTSTVYDNSVMPEYKEIDFSEPPFTETTPPTAPAGALLFEPFYKQDSTHVWRNTIGVGSPIVGNAPTGDTTKFGILNKTCFATQGYTFLHWNVGQVNYEVKFTRINHTRLQLPNIYEHYVCKAIDGDNFIDLQYDHYGTLRAFKCEGSRYSPVQIGSNITLANTFTSLRAKFTGTTMEIFVDSSTTPVATITIPSGLASGTNVGTRATSSLLPKLDTIEVIP